MASDDGDAGWRGEGEGWRAVAGAAGWSAWFGDLDLAHEDDGTTSLTGVIADQAELHGLLTKIRDLGVTLISVTVVDRPDAG